MPHSKQNKGAGSARSAPLYIMETKTLRVKDDEKFGCMFRSTRSLPETISRLDSAETRQEVIPYDGKIHETIYEHKSEAHA